MCDVKDHKKTTDFDICARYGGGRRTKVGCVREMDTRRATRAHKIERTTKNK